jgi:tRNA1(Val) A37 N6-methylase TrmN6
VSDADQKRKFKGWAVPGPEVPDPQTPGISDSRIHTEEGESLDALSGNYRIFQYRDGHRFSTDDLLVAWYGSSCCPRAERVLDLGSGIGSVGMTAAWRLPAARFVTVEAQDISVALARKSVKYNGLEDRYEIRLGDFRDSGALAPDEKFDLVMGSPPYFPLGTGILGDHPQKVACRFEVRGSITDYCATASRHLEWGGVFSGIFPNVQRDRVLEAADRAGLIIIRAREVVFREGEPALLWLFLMMKAEHLPESFKNRTWNEPPLVIRTKSGEIHPEYSAIKLSIGFPP